MAETTITVLPNLPEIDKRMFEKAIGLLLHETELTINRLSKRKSPLNDKEYLKVDYISFNHGAHMFTEDTMSIFAGVIYNICRALIDAEITMDNILRLTKIQTLKRDDIIQIIELNGAPIDKETQVWLKLN